MGDGGKLSRLGREGRGGDSSGFGAENRMERTNWTLLCGASHCCSFECITRVKCGVQDGHVGGNRQRRRTAVAEEFRSFKRMDGRGDIETQECIVLFPIGLNIGRRGERGGRRDAGAGGRRPSARPSVSPAGERTDEHRLLAPIPRPYSPVRSSVPTLTGNTRWRKLSGDSDRARRAEDGRVTGRGKRRRHLKKESGD